MRKISCLAVVIFLDFIPPHIHAQDLDSELNLNGLVLECDFRPNAPNSGFAASFTTTLIGTGPTAY